MERAVLPQILEFLKKKDAVLVGPGLRDTDDSYAFVRELVAQIERPLVIDASGLNAFAGRASEVRASIVTPHPGEMARLLGRSTKEINDDRVEAAREAARVCNCVVVLKGHHTLVADPEGHVNVNPTGNPGMASGGMGDVLAGMTVALLGRGLDPFDAACTAVYLHGYTGDLLAEEMGDTGLAAMDLAERIPAAIQKLR
jgi:NAD(P)H-hydrate epimerase